MTARRARLLDAAIEVIGAGGIRALTHRAVDAAAGLPPGSASNLFRTRDTLIEGVVERFAERERANWERLAAGAQPSSARDLADLLSRFAYVSTHEQRTLTLARYAILTEAAIRPPVRAHLLATGARVNAWAMGWMRAAGSADPGRDAPLIMNYWTGLVLHQLAMPDPSFDPAERLRALVEAVLTAAEAS
ncbi:TetR family transcriptional regulator [Dactylosporangium vinaceum]|uniref:TetR/AcrR family transcriptional regulator n=1 Tax=Dactylosporangium vinaceum TaxID=53362 RepID=A0ABV5M8Z8_9ACTN|nr:TetR/AcrR family transcriptional regulator [Dactylosporangium vinaceum]UAB99531.1 TetR family transcriptional regulator [Dactylosporangium vinaceum]